MLTIKNLISGHKTLFIVLPFLLMGIFTAHSMACESSFNPQTGTVTLPCVREVNSTKLYSVEMEHRGDLNFEVTSAEVFELVDAAIDEVEARVIDIPGSGVFGGRKGAIIDISGTYVCQRNDIYDNVEIKVQNPEPISGLSGSIDISLKEKRNDGRFCPHSKFNLYEEIILVDQSLSVGLYDIIVNGESQAMLAVQ